MTRIRTWGGLLAAVTILLAAQPALAQNDAKSMLGVGRKQEKAAVGLKGEERAKALGAALATYEEIGRTWPDALPEKAEAKLRASSLLRRLDRESDALTALDEVLQIAGQAKAHARALMEKGGLLRKLKRFDEARAAWQRLIDDLADQPGAVADARLSIAKLARQLKDWDGAAEQAELVLTQHADLWRENVEACDLLVSIHVKRRDWPKALAALDACDKRLEERFGGTEIWPKVEKAMAKMSSRKQLTPADEDEA